MAATRSPTRGIAGLVASRDNGNALSEIGRDGMVEFRLTPCSHGICVERRQLRARARLTSHAMRFPDENSFLDWCEADVLKFSYPLVYSRLKRHGCALLARGQSDARAV